MLLLYSNDQKMFSFTFCESNASILSNLVKKSVIKFELIVLLHILLKKAFLEDQSKECNHFKV